MKNPLYKLCPETQTIEYSSLDAAMKDFRRMLAGFRRIRISMERLGEHENQPLFYRQTCQTIQFLEDENQVREVLRGYMMPDGRVVSSCSAEEWEFRQNLERLDT